MLGIGGNHHLKLIKIKFMLIQWFIKWLEHFSHGNSDQHKVTNFSSENYYSFGNNVNLTKIESLLIKGYF